MKNKFIPTISIIILFFIFSILYKGLQNTNIFEPKVENNIEIPIFKAKTLYGDLEINSLEFFKKDKFYLLNIWASWCVPCRDEHPQLMNLSKRNQDCKE